MWQLDCKFINIKKYILSFTECKREEHKSAVNQENKATDSDKLRRGSLVRLEAVHPAHPGRTHGLRVIASHFRTFALSVVNSVSRDP